MAGWDTAVNVEQLHVSGGGAAKVPARDERHAVSADTDECVVGEKENEVVAEVDLVGFGCAMLEKFHGVSFAQSPYSSTE